MGSFAQVAVVKAGDYNCVSNRCLGDGVSGRVGAILGPPVVTLAHFAKATKNTPAPTTNHQEYLGIFAQLCYITQHPSCSLAVRFDAADSDRRSTVEFPSTRGSCCTHRWWSSRDSATSINVRPVVTTANPVPPP